MKEPWGLPPEAQAALVCAMAEVLAISHRPSAPAPPLVCREASSKPPGRETRPPLEATPGPVARSDHAYARNGGSKLLMACAPFAGWRHGQVTDRRTKVAFAHCLQDWFTGHSPHAEMVTLVMDNLKTPHPSSLDDACEPAEANSLVDRCDLHSTPHHGRGLTMAAIACSALQRQCLERRMPDQETLREDIAAWEERRNAHEVQVNGRFTTADARIRLKRLYPSIKN